MRRKKTNSMIDEIVRQTGLSPEEVAEKLEDYERDAEHLKTLMLMEDEAKRHKPTAEEPFELGGAISVKHIKEILSYLPEDSSIALDHPAFVSLFNTLHRAGRENFIIEATIAANSINEDDEMSGAF